LPKVDGKYACDTSKRILFGHSLAGEFVLYSMLDNATHPLFKKCIAASCSIGLGIDNYVFGLERQVATQVSDLPVTLYMGVGNYVGSATIMHQEFYNRIKSRGYPNLKSDLKLTRSNTVQTLIQFLETEFNLCFQTKKNNNEKLTFYNMLSSSINRSKA
jgi:predicted alpha/beta superfamily hydrolase